MFLVWYSIDRVIQENESIFCVKNIFCTKNSANEKSKQVVKDLLQKNWGQLILLLTLLKLSLCPSNVFKEYISIKEVIEIIH